MEVDLNQPRNYYFKAESVDGEDFFLITPKDYFDTEGCLYDDEIPELESTIHQYGFDYLADSTFEYNNGDLNTGKQVLLKLGFVENNNM